MSTLRPTRLITVSSPEFLLGTRVMLDSFLRHNDWFSGDIFVLHRRLDSAATAQLEAEFPSLKCRTVSVRLAEAIAALVDAFPQLLNRQDRFLSLEMLLIEPDADTLFLDSDILITASFAELAPARSELIACPDASLLRGRTRDLATMEEFDTLDAEATTTFNAGMIMLGRTLPQAQLCDEMLAYLKPESWGSIQSDHTDQAVWNRLMANRVRLQDYGYNFMLGHKALYPEEKRLRQSIRALHFNGRAKPWLPEYQRAAATQDGLTAWAFEQWRLGCRAMLERQRTT